MCGILATLRSAKLISKAQFKAALEDLAHRGPDDEGIESFQVDSGELTLGHRRLSIIDLTKAGHQPMLHSTGRYSIVYNGEIYNYRELRSRLETHGCVFNGNSDTEVLLNAWAIWGISVLRILQGMFVFAVYDRYDQSLTCVRDAFGIKPLFFRRDFDGFSIASEIDSLVRLSNFSAKLNLQQAYDYLVHSSYDSSDSTFIDGIQQLLPGHWLKICCRTQRSDGPKQWWKPSLSQVKNLNFKTAATQLRDLFLESIALHLRSDVPIGVALSGGLDSSAIASSIHYIEPKLPIHSFTFTATGDTIDEGKWAMQIVQHIKATPHLVEIEADELAADLDDMIKAQGEPFGSTSIYAQYRLFKAARQAGITVVIDGQGADELLAGYSGYPHARLRSLLSKGDFSGAISFLKNWSNWPGRSLLQAPRILSDSFMPRIAASFLRQKLGHSHLWLDHNWFRSQGINCLNNTGWAPKFENDVCHRHLSSALQHAQSNSGLPALLRHADRNSMHWSLESRVPFLTTRLAEFLLSMPEDYLLSPQGETKHLFRAAMRGIVPDTILDRRDKVGFATPELRWLQQLQPVIPLWLSSAKSLPFLDAEAVVSHVEAVLTGQKPFSWQVWRLINFCRWFSLTQPQLP